MSGRIYDPGVDPICDKCGSVMWTSAEMNFNGARCIKGCNGNPIYSSYPMFDELKRKSRIIENNEGEIVLEGVISSVTTKCRSLKEMKALNLKNGKTT